MRKEDRNHLQAFTKNFYKTIINSYSWVQYKCYNILSLVLLLFSCQKELNLVDFTTYYDNNFQQEYISNYIVREESVKL